MNNYLYRVPEHCESTYDIESVHNADDKLGAKWILQQAGDHYWDNHDGWDCRWPMTFELLDAETQNVIMRAEVNMETIPSFYVSEIENFNP